MGGADTMKKKRQGDEIRRVVTSMVLPNLIVARVCVPSELQELGMELLVA